MKTFPKFVRFFFLLFYFLDITDVVTVEEQLEASTVACFDSRRGKLKVLKNIFSETGSVLVRLTLFFICMLYTVYVFYLILF